VTLVIGVGLVVLAFAFVLLPLFRKPSSRATEGPDPAVLRAGLYQQILDAELDTRLGKLDSVDFQELRMRLLGDAAALIVADRGEAIAEEDATARFEHEIAAARAALRAKPSMRGVNA